MPLDVAALVYSRYVAVMVPGTVVAAGIEYGPWKTSTPVSVIGSGIVVAVPLPTASWVAPAFRHQLPVVDGVSRKRSITAGLVAEFETVT